MAKRDEKIGKYNRLWFELRERREGYTAKVILTIIEYIGGGMKEVKQSIRQIFEYDINDKELEWVSKEMQKTVLWESQPQIRKLLSGQFPFSRNLRLININLFRVRYISGFLNHYKSLEVNTRIEIYFDFTINFLT